MSTKQNRRDFIAALRSGEYKQGQGMLFNPHAGCYCVLGVAEHLALGRCKNPFVPRLETIAWLGLELDSPVFWASNDLVEEIVSANDLGKMTFLEMADMLEDRWFSDERG